MASDCGIRMMVPVRVNRNQNKRLPSRTVFHRQRYGSATRAFGPHSRRMSAQRVKNAPDQNKALNTPERHQSSLSPCWRAANIRANPALRYRNPTKLGAELPFFRAGADGMPKQIQIIITGAIRAEPQNIQCQESC